MADPTVGVEEEYQLVDPATGGLRSGAVHVLRSSWTDDLQPELQETMVEIQTPPSTSMAEVAEHLRRRRLTASASAGVEGLEIVSAGTHPFSDWRGHVVAEGERADLLVARFGRVAWTEHIFGLHVHVAQPVGLDAAVVLREARWLSPLLIALSCSSPYYQGQDTGYASYRSVIQRRLPLTGPPPATESKAAYDALVDGLLRAGVLPDTHTVYWNVRLSAVHPTIEFRGMDACPRVEDAVAIAALARGAVAHVATGGTIRPPGGTGDLDDTLLGLNEWQAARFGLEAPLALPGERGIRGGSIREEADRVLHLLRPCLVRLGDGDAEALVHGILERGTAADRLRELRSAGRDMRGLVDWLRTESQLGLGSASGDAP